MLAPDRKKLGVAVAFSRVRRQVLVVRKISGLWRRESAMPPREFKFVPGQVARAGFIGFISFDPRGPCEKPRSRISSSRPKEAPKKFFLVGAFHDFTLLQAPASAEAPHHEMEVHPA